MNHRTGLFIPRWHPSSTEWLPKPHTQTCPVQMGFKWRARLFTLEFTSVRWRSPKIWDLYAVKISLQDCIHLKGLLWIWLGRRGGNRKILLQKYFCQSILIHYPVQQWESRPNRGSWRRQRRRGRERVRTRRSFWQQIWSCGTTKISCWLVSWGGGRFISHFMNFGFISHFMTLNSLKLLWVFFAASKRDGGCQRVRQFFAQHFSPSRLLLKFCSKVGPF